MDIKKAIKINGGTISAIAKELGISQSALSQQINNNTITLAKVERIAHILNVPLSILVDSTEQSKGTSTTEHQHIVLKCPHCGNDIHISAN